ncbi:MAG: hypothetical protein QOI06_2461 [Nocardioidaceae bacterium]|jgi:DNA-binding transcriptional ArsR family regulator|nr:hypothetical protein [Nocardioidaceae bacterium]
MEPRVEIGEGTGFEVLLAAAALADPNWRETFATGQASHAEAEAILGPGFVRRVAALGRFGWINLAGLLTRAAPPWDLRRLIAMVSESAPEDVHYVAIGGDRRQLLDLLDEDVIRGALAGKRQARSRLGDVFASDAHVLEATDWLLTSSSSAVRGEILELLDSWREQLLPSAAESALVVELHRHATAAETRLAGIGSRAYLDETIGGLSYYPAGLDRVVAVSSPRVAPVIVVVDGREHTIILHPPIGGPEDEADDTRRLLELSRAVGDRTRMRLLTALRGGELTAVDLARDLGAPRTTLLHHLAILRAAGLIHVSVTPGNATLYRLRPAGFSELSGSAARSIPSA